MKYRKKPIEIEAIRLDGTNTFDDMCTAWAPKFQRVANFNCGCLTIHTLEGIMTASEGDWIIKGVKDEFYPCKPDIFEATYDPVSP